MEKTSDSQLFEKGSPLEKKHRINVLDPIFGNKKIISRQNEHFTSPFFFSTFIICNND